MGYDAKIGGICNNDFKYSILEISGWNELVYSFAHSLGHMWIIFKNNINLVIRKLKYSYFSLGAVHDGTVINSADASQCPASDNYIMTPNLGAFSNPHNLYYYSNCSINQFKKTLLSSSGGYT